MALKEGDFVTLHFTGTDLQEQEVFDTTKADDAKKHGLGGNNMEFSPLTICVGKGHMLAGLDKALIGRKDKESFTITLNPEDAFGKKRADHIKLMPLKVFRKEGIDPQPGLDVNIDGVRGRVKSISGNRVIVDFNNPLSGKKVAYEVELLGKIEDLKTQVEAVVSRALRFDADITVKEGVVTVTLPFELPEKVQKEVRKQVTDLTAAKTVSFEKTKA